MPEGRQEGRVFLELNMCKLNMCDGNMVRLLAVLAPNGTLESQPHVDVCPVDYDELRLTFRPQSHLQQAQTPDWVPQTVHCGFVIERACI